MKTTHNWNITQKSKQIQGFYKQKNKGKENIDSIDRISSFVAE